MPSRAAGDGLARAWPGASTVPCRSRRATVPRRPALRPARPAPPGRGRDCRRRVRPRHEAGVRCDRPIPPSTRPALRRTAPGPVRVEGGRPAGPGRPRDRPRGHSAGECQAGSTSGGRDPVALLCGPRAARPTRDADGGAVATLDIRLFGDPVLRQEARQVDDFDDRLATLADEHARDHARRRRRGAGRPAGRRAQAPVHLGGRRGPRRGGRQPDAHRRLRRRPGGRRGLPVLPRPVLPGDAAAACRDRVAGPRRRRARGRSSRASSPGCGCTRWTTSTASCSSTTSPSTTARRR